jgi:arginase
MRVCFISVPYDLGRYDVGHGQGPRSLMSSGLDKLLSEAGYAVDTKTIICGDAEQLTDIQTTFRLNAQLSEAIAEVVNAGTFPIVLAGNCITSSGTVSGLDSEDLHMLWLDAHADFNTPETTESGYLDGMALSIACGRCWKRLSATNPRFRPIKEENVTLVGTRDLDAEEAMALSASKVRVFAPEKLRKNSLQIPDQIGPRDTDLCIHLDADVLDAGVGRASRFASKGGLLETDVNHLLSWAISSYRVVALAITAYGPDYDAGGSIKAILARLIISSVGLVAASQQAYRAP